jgi:hypothetical protein
VPAHHALTPVRAPNAWPHRRHGLCFATFALVSTHTTLTFPYKLVCSAVILEHFRWRTFRDFYNCLLLLALYYPELAQSHFQPTLTLLESAIHIGRLISYALSIWASIKALPSPVSASSINPLRRSHSAPRKAPVLYGVIRQAIVLKCTISNTWLVRLTRRSRVFRLVSVLPTCTAISFPIRPSLALIGPFISHHRGSMSAHLVQRLFFQWLPRPQRNPTAPTRIGQSLWFS